MKKSIFKIFYLLLLVFSVFAVVGCGDDKDPQEVSITFNAPTTTITKGETIKLDVKVTGSDDTTYQYVISDPSLVKIENDTLSVIDDVTADRTVTVIVFANADASKKETKVFTVKFAEEKSVEITTQRNTITFGETIALNVAVKGFSNSAYGWYISDTSILKIDNNVLSVLKDVTVDTVVTIKAFSVDDNSVFDEKQITVKAPTSLGSITISAASDTIAEGEEVLLSAIVTGVEDTTYTWSVSHENLVKIENNVLKLIGTVKVDTNITVTCTANGDESLFKSKTIIIKAPIIPGQVGELTSDLIAEVANSNITISGVVTNKYTDFNNTFNSKTTKMDSLVMMSTGRWFGQWNYQNDTENIIANNYRKGEQDGIKNSAGVAGHALEELYINKNNEVASKMIKDYMSIPAVWEAQHLWNHLGNLSIEKFTYNSELLRYEYNIDLKNIEDLYLMTYLSYCLTPMLEDTLHYFAFVIEEGKISKIIARTEILYYGSETAEEASAMSVTELELSIHNVGNTVVPNPQTFEAPEYVELLEQAIQKMQNATNYTYRAVDTTTYAPSGDSGEYEISASAKEGATIKFAPRTTLIGSVSSNKVANNQSATGTVGEFGQVTENAILIANTGKYSYGMDDKLYHTEYYGFKQNDDNTYDEFEYQTRKDPVSGETSGSLTGTRKIKGTISELLPKFEFSANIFEFAGTKGTGSNTTYIFVLREGAITRDIAMEVSMHSYAEDAESSTDSLLTIVVDANGNLVSTKYPYNLTGVYYGVIETKYSEVGTTEIAEDTFDDYVPRVWRTTWEEYTCKYYSPEHTSATSREENAAVVLNYVFKEHAVDLPSPQIFVEVFDDMVFGPFFDYRENGTDANGETIYKEYVSINVESSEFDENSRITNYEELMNELITALQEEGYVLDQSNTDTSGGQSGYGDRYVVLTKGQIEIVITNNQTKHLSIYFYHLGDWILNK